LLSVCLPCRRELSYFGVKVAIIEPGYFKTAMTKGDSWVLYFKEQWGKTSTEVKEIYGENFLASCE
jgi:retinol dehydrogenase-16